MDWMELYPKDRQPTAEEITAFIGEGAERWTNLTEYMQTAYSAKPVYSYSGCSGKPGWNVKYKKSGQAFGTLYPEPGFFSVFLVVAYRLDNEMELLLPTLTEETAERYRQADDYMKMGKWMMFPIDTDEKLEDYKRIMAVKLKPKNP